MIRALEDDSIGRVVDVTGYLAEVAWEDGTRVDYDLRYGQYEVYSTMADAREARRVALAEVAQTLEAQAFAEARRSVT